MASRVRVHFSKASTTEIEAIPPRSRGPGMLVVDNATGLIWQFDADSAAGASSSVLVPDYGDGRWLANTTVAEASLTTRVSTEESTRTAAVTSLDTRVSTEASTRTSADTSLTTRVSTAESTEASTTTSLTTRVSTETSGRTSAVVSVDLRLSALYSYASL